MKVDDIIVEVRDGALSRRGVVPSRDLNITAQQNRNNVGSWTLRLPVESPLCEYLRQPGAGILVTGVGAKPYSGPVTSVQEADSVEDPQGTVTFTGVTDDIIFADLLAWPDPATADVNKQRYEEDVREGKAETVLHSFVRVNAGPGALAARRNGTLASKLVMGPDYGRGANVRKAARFETIGEVLRDVADVAGLNFGIAQYGNELRFETSAVRDRTKFVRLDVWNNTLSSHTTTVSAPAVTNVIVGGRGEGVDRWFYTKAGEAAELQRWGRRIERFVENSSSDDDTVLAQTADETLATDGSTAVDVQVVPMDDAGTMVLGKDWDLGDTVTVVSNGSEEQSVVSGWILKADSSGVRVGAVLGDPTSTSVESRLANTEQRVSALERRVEVTASITEGRPTLTSGFVVYGGSDYPTWTIDGNTVTVDGAMAPANSSMASAISSTSSQLAFTLPAGKRPGKAIRVLCQGSSFDNWLLTADTTGQVTVSRYTGTAGPATSSSNGTWLPFHFTFTARN